MIRLDNFSTFRKLREEFEFFSYERYHWRLEGKELRIEYLFNLSDKYFFSPKIRIPYKPGIFRTVDSLSPSVVNLLVFQIGMIELISYWKAACPKKVIIKPAGLSSSQVNFWKKNYYQGLGEFFYLNSIDTNEEDFMDIIFNEISNPERIFPTITEGSLVPVGGGKDSAVTMELMNKSGVNWLPMTVNPGNAVRNVIQAAGKTAADTIEIHREIHPLLLTLNKEGFLNGHTPFSALLAFYSLLAAYLSGRSDIILSNESSANEATVPGTTINHQYSKSLEFEKDFREYVRTNISGELNYFSFLRPVSELQIAMLFSAMEPYHDHFRSCNVGSKTGTWCGHCPKCLFTFIILSPFLSPERLTGVFGRNLLNDLSLQGTLEELTGVQEVKPFECIGTVEEVKLALQLSAKNYEGNKLPALLEKYIQKSGTGNLNENGPGELLKNISAEHFIPEKYFNLLSRALK
jgi:hypothetical protein